MKLAGPLLWLSAALCCFAEPLPPESSVRDASDEDVEDPVAAVQIIRPPDGAIEKSPVMFKTVIHLRPGSSNQLFETLYEGGSLCIEVNDEIVHCSPIDQSTFWFHHVGNCTARALLIRSGSFKPEDRGLYPHSRSVTFTQVNETEFNAHVSRQIEKEHKRHRTGYLQSLAEWAEARRSQPDPELLQSTTASEDQLQTAPLLVVGVRTAVVSNFSFRQAIRETWASKSVLPQGVKVVFLGCRLPGGDSSASGLWESVELEKQVYGDLLTDELDCEDAYGRLADKTREFFHYAAAQFPDSQCVMVADDDLYLRLDKIAAWLKHLGPLRHFYAGHVRALQSITKIPPNRNPASRHYLPHKQYPMRELPPFALGANFFLSMDCVRFVSKNRHRLRDLGGMDDISTALWMLSLQVHPKHLTGLDHLNWGPCTDDLVALSDLTVSAIRVIHDNVVSGRRFCHGFEWSVWMRSDIGTPPKRSLSIPFPREALRVEFSSRSLQEEAGELEVVSTVSTPTHAGLKAVYRPVEEEIEQFAERVCVQTRLRFPGAADSSCSELIQSEFLLWFDQLKTSQVTANAWSSDHLYCRWQR